MCGVFGQKSRPWLIVASMPALEGRNHPYGHLTFELIGCLMQGPPNQEPKFTETPIWGVVKIMVPFWVLSNTAPSI